MRTARPAATISSIPTPRPSSPAWNNWPGLFSGTKNSRRGKGTSTCSARWPRPGPSRFLERRSAASRCWDSGKRAGFPLKTSISWTSTKTSFRRPMPSIPCSPSAFAGSSASRPIGTGSGRSSISWMFSSAGPGGFISFSLKAGIGNAAATLNGSSGRPASAIPKNPRNRPSGPFNTLPIFGRSALRKSRNRRRSSTASDV